MPISTELPVQTPVADTRNQVNRAWKDVLKMSVNSVVVAVAALFVVILVVTSVTFHKSMPDQAITAEFWVGP